MIGSKIFHKSRIYGRWVLPFSRQFCATAVSLAPLVPWAWKMALLRAWLVQHYYRPCGLEHLIPTCGLERMEFTGAHPGLLLL